MKKKSTSAMFKVGRVVFPFLFVFAVCFFSSCGSDDFKSSFEKESGNNPPSPGNNGILSAFYSNIIIFNVQWQKANDDSTPSSKLQYRVFASTSIFSSYNDALLLADELTPGWTLDISSLQVTIPAGSGYQWCNVFVRDENNNITAYTGVAPVSYNNTPPAAGGGGNITITSPLPLNVTLVFEKGTDLQTPQTLLQYRAYYSLARENVDTFEHASSLGTEITAGWIVNVASIQATLSAGGTFWFNVFVMDDMGLLSAYTPKQGTVSAKTPPVIPAGGLSFTSSSSNITVSFPRATDPDGETPQPQLQYRVFCSTSSAALGTSTPPVSSSTVWEITSGWISDWSSSTLLSVTATGLSQGTTYYFNVYVRDYDLMISAYGATAYNTITVVPPTPGGSGALTLVRNRDSVNVAWQAATSSVTPRYRVYYSTTADNIATYTAAETSHNGIEITNGWTSGLTQITANSLARNTLYYFNVFVIGEEDSVSAYTTGSVTLPANVAPVLPANPLPTSAINTGFTASIGWSKSSDDYTQTELLQYRVFCSTANTGTTYANYFDANGNALVQEITLGWTADISSAVTQVLNRNVTYYCNVFVRDSDGLISSYTTCVIAVPTSVLTPGSAGHLSLSSGYLTWTAAVDEFTPQNKLQYRVFSSTSATAMLADTLPSTGTSEITSGWTENITSIVAGSSTQYYNVYVRNLDGTIKAYSQFVYNAPQPGNNGTITAVPKAAKKVDLSWTAATDSVTPQSALQYCIYSSEVVSTGEYSALDTVSTYSNAVAGASAISPTAVLEMPWTANIIAFTPKMLKNSTYYFNVFVQDADGNISPYVPVSATTN
jgi:hypothetical protein